MLFWVTFTALGVPGGAGYVLGSAERCNIDELLFSTWRDVKVHAFSFLLLLLCWCQSERLAEHEKRMNGEKKIIIMIV